MASRSVVVGSLGLLLMIAVVASAADLSDRYYDTTCPKAQDIVRSVLQRRVAGNGRMAPAILRLFFHDCFVNGCDASVLLDPTDSSEGEKNADPNKTLDGYDVIDEIKSALEQSCPATVSCADILAIASRDAVAMLGGPSWSVLLGRKDSRGAASKDYTTQQLPDPTKRDLNVLVSEFYKKGLDERDLTALSGAHTVGMAHSCDNYRDRVDTVEDIDPSYAAQLRQSCDRKPVPFDERTPMRFDNLYYKDLLLKRGLLASDQALYTPGTWAGELVKMYGSNQDMFFQDFTRAMVKMGNITPPPGSWTEVRLQCRKVNQY